MEWGENISILDDYNVSEEQVLVASGAFCYFIDVSYYNS